jgi:hypothetical protein
MPQSRQPAAFVVWTGTDSRANFGSARYVDGGSPHCVDEPSRQVGLRYRSEPGVLFYTHISDHYTPFYTKVIAANPRDAAHLLDGLATAVAEKVSALQTAQYFADRQARADFKAFDRIMRRKGAKTPRKGDEMPS